MTQHTENSSYREKLVEHLLEKPSGCVVWIYIDERTLRLGPFLYFGAEAGKPLPSPVDRKIAKHTKGDKDGVKAERPNIRVLPKGSFTQIESIEDLYMRLFFKA